MSETKQVSFKNKTDQPGEEHLSMRQKTAVVYPTAATPPFLTAEKG